MIVLGQNNTPPTGPGDMQSDMLRKGIKVNFVSCAFAAL